MKEKGVIKGLLATVAVAALLSAALGGTYSLSKEGWNGGWSFETLENNVDLVAETVLSGWGGGDRDNHSTDNFPADNSPVDNSSTDNTSDLGFWDTHSLNAVPVVRENASAEDLPTVGRVENILFNWSVFENERPPLVGNWTGSFDFVLSMINQWGLEYHFDENGRLHVDTPGWVYETPNERDDSEYMIGNFVMENGGGSRNALDFCRHLRGLGIPSGIAILKVEGWYPQPKVVIPVKSGLMYSDQCGVGRGASWTGIWHATNVEPGEPDPWTDSNPQVNAIELYWRLSEGDYVQWNYVLENGEPTMIRPENGEPVGWWTRE